MTRDGIASEVLAKHAAASHKGPYLDALEWGRVVTTSMRLTELFTGQPLTLTIH